MRKAYHDQLSGLAEHLAAMCAMVGTAMGKATTALLDADLTLAEEVITSDSEVDNLRSQAEEHAYALLALQAPVASDLRTVLAAIHAAESLERMGDLALHVAKTARRRHPKSALPESVKPYFVKMGEVAVALAASAEKVIRTNDATLARSIEDDDDEMDDLHQHLFTVLMDRDWPHGVAAAVDITLLGRFYERFADHAVSVAKRTVFVVTGQMPGSGMTEVTL
ncbi:MAG: phosphate signaling complex protein PhoU [Sciscionella sp.]